MITTIATACWAEESKLMGFQYQGYWFHTDGKQGETTTPEAARAALEKYHKQKESREADQNKSN